VLIMLPESLGNADIFYLQLLHLASRARCIAIDYPESPTAALADGLAALIDVFNIGRAKRSAASRPWRRSSLLQCCGRYDPEKTSGREFALASTCQP
jgi:hypothetical protein